jgi:hypothetical protein
MTKRNAITAMTMLGSVLFAATAHATYIKQFPASLCVASNGNPPVSMNIFGQAQNESTTAGATWFCPVIRDSANLFNSSATEVIVNGFSNGPGALIAQSCRASATGGNMVCDPVGPNGDSTGIGVVLLSWYPVAPATAWRSSTPEDAFYVVMTVAPGVTVFGYSVLD